MRLIGMKIGGQFKDVTNIDKLVEALKLNKSIGLDIETFYKDKANYPKKKSKKEIVIDWSQLNPDTGEIRSIQIYLPLQQTSVMLTGDGLDDAKDHPFLAAILEHVQDTSKETIIHNFLYESQWFLTKFAVPMSA